MEKGRKFAAFDIDGTLIRWQLYHAIADALAKHGYISTEAYAAIRDARMGWKTRRHAESFREYELDLVKLFNQILANLSYTHFMEAAEDVFEEYKDQIYTYTRDLIKRLKKDGYLLFAISGSQIEVLQLMAEHYRFDDFVGSTFVHKNDRFTGETVSPYGRKDEVLKELAAKHGATFSGSIAVGDSTSDIQMLEIVENPIVFNPERRLFEHARKKGWKIVVERKNLIYELEKEDGKYQLVEASKG
jgi:HAD superfamily hydrolase (TIGR01490 family)